MGEGLRTSSRATSLGFRSGTYTIRSSIGWSWTGTSAGPGLSAGATTGSDRASAPGTPSTPATVNWSATYRDGGTGWETSSSRTGTGDGINLEGSQVPGGLSTGGSFGSRPTIAGGTRGSIGGRPSESAGTVVRDIGGV